MGPTCQSSPGEEEALPRLVLMLRDGQTCTVEREHVVDETVSRRTERVIDPRTGESRIRTLEFVEKVVEKEVTGTPPPPHLTLLHLACVGCGRTRCAGCTARHNTHRLVVCLHRSHRVVFWLRNCSLFCGRL